MPSSQRHGVLQVPAHGQNRRRIVGPRRGVPIGSGANPRARRSTCEAVGPDANDRIVHRADDRPVVRQQHVGDRAKPLDRRPRWSMAIGSSERLPLVQTIGRPTAAISRWCSGV